MEESVEAVIGTFVVSCIFKQSFTDSSIHNITLQIDDHELENVIKMFIDDTSINSVKSN